MGKFAGAGATWRCLHFLKVVSLPQSLSSRLGGGLPRTRPIPIFEKNGWRHFLKNENSVSLVCHRWEEYRLDPPTGGKFSHGRHHQKRCSWAMNAVNRDSSLEDGTPACQLRTDHILEFVCSMTLASGRTRIAPRAGQTTVGAVRTRARTTVCDGHEFRNDQVWSETLERTI